MDYYARTFGGGWRIEQVFCTAETGTMSLRSTYTPTSVKGHSGERSSSRASAAEAAEKKPKKKENWSSLPDIWALIHPRRGILYFGFGVLRINRAAWLGLSGL